MVSLVNLLADNRRPILSDAQRNIVVPGPPVPTVVIPDVTGDDLWTAGQTLAAASLGAIVLSSGQVSPVVNPNTPIGLISTQSPPAGTVVTAATPVDLQISSLSPSFDVSVTVISQYANSPTLLQLCKNMAQYVDPSANLAQFYGYVWNVATAVGFGLDIWGKIVRVKRQLSVGSQQVTLIDSDFRTLIYAKALANISAMTAPAFNQLLQNLFPGLRSYVLDSGGMTFDIRFNFFLTVTQLAIVKSSGVFPHPAGVQTNIVVVGETFGFRGSGLKPFNYGVFY